MKRHILILAAALIVVAFPAFAGSVTKGAVQRLDLDQLTLDGTTVTSTGAELNILDGVTSTAAELNILDTVTATATDLNLLDQTNNATNIGAVNAPGSGTTAVTITRQGPYFKLDFTLTAAQIPVTDAAGSGSYGTLKLFDFVEGAVSYMGCRQDYTAFAEGAALTGAAGDASFDIGVGTVAISAAADGALTGTDDDIGSEVNITLSGGTGTGTGTNGAQGFADGTATATDLNLNWSGTAATIDANSTIDVTGTITCSGMFLGDD